MVFLCPREEVIMKERWIVIIATLLMLTSCSVGTEQKQIIQVDEELVHTIEKQAIEEVIYKDEEIIEVAKEELAEPIKVIFTNPIVDLDEPTIELKSVILNPGEVATSSCNITLLSDILYDDLRLVYVDTIDEKVIEIVPIEIENSGDRVENILPNKYTYYLNKLVGGRMYDCYFIDDKSYSVPMKFTLPEAEGPTKLLVYGDLQGYRADQYQTFANKLKVDLHEGVDLVLFLGDLVDLGNEASHWAYLYDSLEVISPKLPISTAIGNHDVYGTRDYYNNSFTYPTNGVLENTYYFDLPYARIIVLDTESPSRFKMQATWLNEISSDVSQPFKIVMMHRGVYPVFYDELYMQYWASIFEDAEIDLVLNGHDHIYSRTSMLNGEKLNSEEAITYIGTGSGSGSKYYDAYEERPWLDFIYDNNLPVKIELHVGKSYLELVTYAGTEMDVKVVDSWTLEK